MNKVLIFGGSGLVGSSLQRVINKKYKVLAPIRSEVDMFSVDQVKKVVEEYEPQIIINAAARVGGIVANNTERGDFIMENLKININLFESIKSNSDIKIVNLGSSCIYPNNAPNPLKEDSLMTGPLEPTNSPYAIAKITGIEIGRAYNIQYGTNVVNLMPTNLYGPNDNFSETRSHVIPGLIRRMNDAKINNDTSFSIWGSGNPLREFLYVDDLANAISLLIEKDISHDLINIGSGQEISIKDLAMVIKKIVNYEGTLVFDSSKPDGIKRKLLDSSLMYSLGWKPSVDLEEGLSKTFEWYINNQEDLKT